MTKKKTAQSVSPLGYDPRESVTVKVGTNGQVASVDESTLETKLRLLKESYNNLHEQLHEMRQILRPHLPLSEFGDEGEGKADATEDPTWMAEHGEKYSPTELCIHRAINEINRAKNIVQYVQGRLVV